MAAPGRWPAELTCPLLVSKLAYLRPDIVLPQEEPLGTPPGTAIVRLFASWFTRYQPANRVERNRRRTTRAARLKLGYS